LERALVHALGYLDGIDSNSVAATASLDQLRARLGVSMADRGLDAVQVVDELVAATAGGHLGSTGGRFFGWVVGGSLPAALAADWLVSAWDQNAGLYACAPASAVLEEVAGSWLKDLLGLPADASFAFTTGCQMSHVTCLAAARNALLARRGWDAERDGLTGAPRLRILTSEQCHGSVDRAARLLGLGARALTRLPSDESGCLPPCVLQAALERDADLPTIVVLQAGDLNVGAYDAYSDLVPIAHRRNAWVHVDGAFGLWAGVSPKYTELLRGIEAADSWATDGHKWLNVPYDCGYAFVADRQAHRQAMSHRANYLTHDSDARDEMDWNPEWSRRGRGAATYAALRELGRQGLCQLIERTCSHARALVTGIGSLEGAEIVREPQINQGLVRFRDPAPHAAEEDHDRRTDAVIRGIAQAGEAFFTASVWRRKRCMRVSVCNWRTNSFDVERSVAAVRRAIAVARSEACH
jgi:glutamate/tyrosine decarboxylase-like PLP-dependent enzyme